MKKKLQKAEKDGPHCGEYNSSADIRTGFISNYRGDLRSVKYCVIDGLAIVEGDIILGTVDQVEALAEILSRSEERVAPRGLIITGGAYRWPSATVSYCISPRLPQQERVIEAMRHWESKTRIRFHNIGSLCNAPIGIVVLGVSFVPGNICASAVGFQHTMQQIILADNCGVGEAIHEIGHTVGLWHEQSRRDRDLHVTIHYDNIQPDERFNFDQHVNDGQDAGPYDYSSIMHYDAYAFAIDTSKPTITTKPPGIPIGQRVGLSQGDIEAVQRMYPGP